METLNAESFILILTIPVEFDFSIFILFLFHLILIILYSICKAFLFLHFFEFSALWAISSLNMWFSISILCTSLLQCPGALIFDFNCLKSNFMMDWGISSSNHTLFSFPLSFFHFYFLFLFLVFNFFQFFLFSIFFTFSFITLCTPTSNLQKEAHHLTCQPISKIFGLRIPTISPQG